MTDHLIDILLATYNGGLYLREQIDSLLAQTHTCWRLIIRDDGSTDDTLEIIKYYRDKYPLKIKVLNDNKKRLGACLSFGELLKSSSADYVMFCDQDDVWLPEKVELTFNKMLSLDTGGPLLVHTDLKVVDERLNVISGSFWKYQHMNPDLVALHRVLIMNNVTGCTTMINRPLKELCLPIPEGAWVHDWWVALVASAFGKIEHIDAATILYRQHGGNDTGAKEYSYAGFLPWPGRFNRTTSIIKKIMGQGGVFYSVYEDRLSNEKRRMAGEFSNLFRKGRVRRVYTLLKYDIRGHGFLRNFGILAIWFFVKGSSITSPDTSG